MGRGGISPSLLTSVLVGELSASRPGRGRITIGEKATGTHLIRGWVGPRAGLGDVEKRKFMTLPGLELRPLGRPARSQSVSRVRTELVHILITGLCIAYHSLPALITIQQDMNEK
jgi:hypothetical protein